MCALSALPNSVSDWAKIRFENTFCEQQGNRIAALSQLGCDLHSYGDSSSKSKCISGERELFAGSHPTLNKRQLTRCELLWFALEPSVRHLPRVR